MPTVFMFYMKVWWWLFKKKKKLILLAVWVLKYQYFVSLDWYNITIQNIAILHFIAFGAVSVLKSKDSLISILVQDKSLEHNQRQPIIEMFGRCDVCMIDWQSWSPGLFSSLIPSYLPFLVTWDCNSRNSMTYFFSESVLGNISKEHLPFGVHHDFDFWKHLKKNNRHLCAPVNIQIEAASLSTAFVTK